ncbi:hypothetical protein BCR33DRAFT_718333 [Rhizoclosmatium globosum]|uniref:Uncharacterized protein n=1 Tax=Rhizoclosmatium globosum TaxID=329046 RepID=A0A1Y2C6H0_9FUNG|nr:hypothetical protein BCR33DRAFT_718333 [Rhizoclosmatium globosum]|eukprot:ORY42638.1 hypothetical protein BCR33DRAFT_718333 [Rhizoclosmatium globosum]
MANSTTIVRIWYLAFQMVPRPQMPFKERKISKWYYINVCLTVSGLPVLWCCIRG